MTAVDPMLDPLIDPGVETATERHTRLVEEFSAHNYHPLPVVIARARGAWVTDVEGRRYLDCLAGYSALNFGHGHPQLLAAAHAQLDRVTLTSRAFGNDSSAPSARSWRSSWASSGYCP